MAHVRVAPGNATNRELAIAEICDLVVRLGDLFDTIRANDRRPSPRWMPYLIAHWGLGELVPYVRDPYMLASVGPAWQRIRGTPGAIRRGIGWVGYSAAFEWAPARRRRWHLWQMRLDRLPDAETDLDPIDGIASLSDDAFSHFWRGFRGWDVRPHEMGVSRWGASAWGRSSGVRVRVGGAKVRRGGPCRVDGVRVRVGGAKWSFGRPLVVDRLVTEAELTALGAWIPPAGASSAWSTMHYPWSTARYPWSIPGRTARRRSIAATLAAKLWHFVFRDAAGAVIGACRAVVHPVAEAIGGAYRIGAGTWSPSASPTAFLAFCRTPFEASPGARVASIDLVADAELGAGVPPGRAWLKPTEIEVAGAASLSVAATVDITMGATIREIVHCLLRID